jgi:hypothetical protein
MLPTMLKPGAVRRLAAAGLAAALAVAVLGSPARAADDPSDIPGIELPGPIVTGILGGDVYDVVYRLDLAPGSILVASLTGSPGTDFDLYLFDASATTVVTNEGVVARSTGPTSTESLAYGTATGGRFYLDLNGASDTQGAYQLTVQTAVDRTPPVVAIAMEGGLVITNTSTVGVTLEASDDLSKVTDMSFSVDGIAFGPWQPYAPRATVILPPGDGQRTIWAKVRNGVGLVSAPATATVTIDTVRPSATAIVPAPGSTVVGLRPAFTVTFDEPMAPASWAGLGLLVQAADGTLVAGAYSYDVARRTGTFVPSSDLHAGSTYVVTVGAVTDLAGNRPDPLGSWTVTVLAPAGLEARATAPVIVFGGSTTIEVHLTGAPLPATIAVQSQPSSATVFDAPTEVVMREGRATLSVTPVRNTVYRFTYAGADGVAPAQVDVRVVVRRSVAFVGAGSATVSRARVGATVRITAALGPALPRTSVSLRLYRYDAGRRAWVYAGSWGRNSDTSGRVSLAWTPTLPGTYYWRAVVAATADHAGNVSPVYRWSIAR